MSELHFKGKEYVYNHHLTVPYRPLVAHPDKSIGNESENLIIHGDNLHALKALLPRYAGKVDCIFIDPPYNTGNENWNYNDNVNSPMLKEWLDGNPVNKEDMLRHDKWLCMMYPRLKLLHELLSENGSFWMTLDDNEAHRALGMLDEIFGEENFLGVVIWEKADSPRMDADFFSTSHDYLIAYSKNKTSVSFHRLGEEDDSPPEHYNMEDDEGRKYYLKPLRAMGGQGETREARPKLFFELVAPDGTKVLPKLQDGRDGAWRWSPRKVAKEVTRIEWRQGKKVAWVPYFRIYADSLAGRPPETIFYNIDVGSSRTAKAQIKTLLGGTTSFETPKPLGLIEKILDIACEQDSIVLDSFAGSATTAHAVLAQNAKDGGNRRFILIECEDYADKLTAERVRRVIKGYKYQGTQKEELLRENVTWSNFSKDGPHQKILNRVQAIENLDSHRFDEIKKTIKDGELIVTGETKVTQKTEGLGGGFTYYTLGDPLDLDKMLTGESLPDYASIGAWLFHTATGEPLDLKDIKEKQWYLGSSAAFHVWLVYKPALDFLKSRDSALTLRLAEKFAKKKDKRHLVFAPSRFVPNKMLLPLGVEYAPLPFALYRIE